MSLTLSENLSGTALRNPGDQLSNYKLKVLKEKSASCTQRPWDRNLHRFHCCHSEPTNEASRKSGTVTQTTKHDPWEKEKKGLFILKRNRTSLFSFLIIEKSRGSVI